MRLKAEGAVILAKPESSKASSLTFWLLRQDNVVGVFRIAFLLSNSSSYDA